MQPWSSNIGGLRDIPEEVAIKKYIDPSIDLMVKAGVLCDGERPFFGEKPFRGYPYRGLWNLWGLVGRRKIKAKPVFADGDSDH